jgi:Serine carboxypeptidase S28
VELEILTSNRSDDLGAASIGVCPGTIPDYILHDDDDDDDPNTKMVEEVMMVVGYTFANDNMAEYPPSTTTSLYKACQIFTSDDGLSSADKVKQFLVQRLGRRRKDEVSKHQTDCWEMTRQLPSGPHATISSGDWSGVGTGDNGESWDFQTCTLLVEAIGFSPDSMFVPRQWSLEWLTRHCQSRFGVTPQPYQIVDKWHFDDLVASNISHILFTNGQKDGWSVSGIQTNLSETLLALNFPNGAHHSDLSHLGPDKNDTADIVQGHKMITSILGLWLEELQATRRSTTDSLVT